MKKLVTLITLIFALIFTVEATAQKFDGLDKSPMDMATYPLGHQDAKKTVRVIYSRPQLKGRSVSELAKAGEVWRTGANEATEITFYKDVNVGGTDVKAGTYSLFTIPGDTEWTVILNSNLHQWGAYSYDVSADVARVQAKAGKAGKALEPFSITFDETNDGANMVMGWGTTRVSLPIVL